MQCSVGFKEDMGEGGLGNGGGGSGGAWDKGSGVRGGKTGLVAIGVGEGRWGCASWWAKSRSWVCSRSDDMVRSRSEFSSGSESSASEGESMGCSRVPRHEYHGLFCGYEMVEDYDGDSLGR